jgi:hypothetical protein
MILPARVSVAVAGIVLSATAFGHHSTTAYDLSRSITLDATVTRFEWTNPHSWINLQVAGTGADSGAWAIEFGAPNLNARAGWKHDDVKVGDKVTVIVSPMRDGSHNATLQSIILPDGRKLLGAAEFLRPPAPGSAPPPAAPAVPPTPLP